MGLILTIKLFGAYFSIHAFWTIFQQFKTKRKRGVTRQWITNSATERPVTQETHTIHTLRVTWIPTPIRIQSNMSTGKGSTALDSGILPKRQLKLAQAKASPVPNGPSEREQTRHRLMPRPSWHHTNRQLYRQYHPDLPGLELPLHGSKSAKWITRRCFRGPGLKPSVVNNV